MLLGLLCHSLQMNREVYHNQCRFVIYSVPGGNRKDFETHSSKFLQDTIHGLFDNNSCVSSISYLICSQGTDDKIS